MLDAIWIIGTPFFVCFSLVVFIGAPYVPTLKAQFEDIRALYPLKKNDVFVDVGSGDGVVLRAVAPYAKKAVGYEINPILWAISSLLSRKMNNTDVLLRDFWSSDLPSDTTVVYTFLGTRYMKKLDKKLQQHVNHYQSKIHFISYGFELPSRSVKRRHGPMLLYVFTPESLQT